MEICFGGIWKKKSVCSGDTGSFLSLFCTAHTTSSCSHTPCTHTHIIIIITLAHLQLSQHTTTNIQTKKNTITRTHYSSLSLSYSCNGVKSKSHLVLISSYLPTTTIIVWNTATLEDPHSSFFIATDVTTRIFFSTSELKKFCLTFRYNCHSL
jgi:hypothetical protein